MLLQLRCVCAPSAQIISNAASRIEMRLIGRILGLSAYAAKISRATARRIRRPVSLFEEHNQHDLRLVGRSIACKPAMPPRAFFHQRRAGFARNFHASSPAVPSVPFRKTPIPPAHRTKAPASRRVAERAARGADNHAAIPTESPARPTRQLPAVAALLVCSASVTAPDASLGARPLGEPNPSFKKLLRNSAGVRRVAMLVKICVARVRQRRGCIERLLQVRMGAVEFVPCRP